jgi:LacI family transcriptional regulator
MVRPATIKDVAAKAGVSVGTVSRVLAKEAAVKADLRLKVEEAITGLGYRPNLTARALRTSQIDVIGIIVPDITNPFFAQLAKSIEAEADLRGHSVMLANSHDDPDAEQRHLSMLLDRSVRGILIAGASDRQFGNVRAHIPIVSLDRRFSQFPLVATDHVSASSLMADHLYALGHRRIAYIAGPQNTEVGRQRLQGFVSCLGALSPQENPIELQVFSAKFEYGGSRETADGHCGRQRPDRDRCVAGRTGYES